MARGMKVAAVFVAVLVAALADQVPSAAPIDGGAGIMSFDQHSPDVTEVASRIAPAGVPVPASPETAPLPTAKLAAVPTAAPGASRTAKAEPTDTTNTTKAVVPCVVGSKYISSELTTGEVVKCNEDGSVDLKMPNGDTVTGAKLRSNGANATNGTAAGRNATGAKKKAAKPTGGATAAEDPEVVNDEQSTPIPTGNLVTNSKMAARINGTGGDPEKFASPLHLDSETAKKITELYATATADPSSTEARVVKEIENIYGSEMPHDVLLVAVEQGKADDASQKKLRLIKIDKAKELKADVNALGEEAREARAVESQEQATDAEGALLAVLQANQTANKKAGQAAVAKAKVIAAKEGKRLELAANETALKAKIDIAAPAADALMDAADKALNKARSNSTNSSAKVTEAENHVRDVQILVKAKQMQAANFSCDKDGCEFLRKKMEDEVHNLQIALVFASEKVAAVKRSASSIKKHDLKLANALKAEALEAQEVVDLLDSQMAAQQAKLLALEPEVVAAAMQEKAAKEKAAVVAQKASAEANTKFGVAKEELQVVFTEQQQSAVLKSECEAEAVLLASDHRNTEALIDELDSTNAQLHDVEHQIQTKKAIVSHKETPAETKDVLMASVSKLQVQAKELQAQALNASHDAKTAAMASVTRHVKALKESDDLVVKAFHVAMKMVCHKYMEAFIGAHHARVALADAKSATIGLEAMVEAAKISGLESEKVEVRSLVRQKEESDAQATHDGNVTLFQNISFTDSKTALNLMRSFSTSSKVKASVKADEAKECDERVNEQKAKCANIRREASTAKATNDTHTLKVELIHLEECLAHHQALMKECSTIRSQQADAERNVQKLAVAKEQLRIARMFMKDYKPVNMSTVKNMSAVLAAERDVKAKFAANASKHSEMYQDEMGKAMATPGMGRNASQMRDHFEALVKATARANAGLAQSQSRLDKSEKKKHAMEVNAAPSSQKKLSDVLALLKSDGAFNCTSVTEGTGAIVAHITPSGANVAGMRWRAVAIDADKAGIKSPWHSTGEEVCNMPPALYRIEFKQVAKPVWNLPRLSADLEMPVEADGFSVVTREFFQSEMEISVASNPEQQGSFLEMM